MDLVHVRDLVPAPGAQWRDGDAFLAGGSWLFSEPQPGVERLLDLHAHDWPALVPHADGSLEIGATCTIAELGALRTSPLFAQCADALLGSFKVHHTATVGGNICLALPAAPMISLTAALDGVCLLLGPDGGQRRLPVTEFVLGARSTALRPGEVLRSVTLPAEALSSRAAFARASLSEHGRSAALVIGRLDATGLVLTVTASVDRPVQVRVPNGASPESASAAVTDAVAGRWYDDVHGDPRWRAAMTSRLVAQVVRELS